LVKIVKTATTEPATVALLSQFCYLNSRWRFHQQISKIASSHMLSRKPDIRLQRTRTDIAFCFKCSSSSSSSRGGRTAVSDP